MTLPTLYKLSDAVKALGPGAPSEWTLRQEVRAGRLHAKRIGRCLRVSDVELTRWALDTKSAPQSVHDQPASSTVAVDKSLPESGTGLGGGS